MENIRGFTIIVLMNTSWQEIISFMRNFKLDFAKLEPVLFFDLNIRALFCGRFLPSYFIWTSDF